MVPSEDPDLLFEFNPGFRKQGFSVNSLGMADEEVSRDKPPGTFRMAFVGDSVSANFGLRPRPEIYLELLADRLNRRADGALRFESLNFGVNAYSILQGLRMAQTRALGLDPDLIVAQLSLNDPHPSDTDYARVAPMHPLRLRNLLFRVARPDRFWGYYFVDRNYDDQGWSHVRRGMQGFAALARVRPVLVVLFPYLYEPGYRDWGYAALHAGYRQEAEAAGVEFVDLLGSFRSAGLLAETWPTDPLHPDAEGHAVAAGVLESELEVRGWLPRAAERNPGETASETRP